ncbi:unnamed protein product [Strongylus vulgaris]|uniref:Uncharacterized protein n=1 Tax=Strongylus vulgaris TaxID=40348 RepID=A0A3P7JJ70_STRVU|nr:unnamed protein product [Strongylus vulgaris]
MGCCVLHDDDNSIDDVDEDKIDEILRDATKNLVIFFCESFLPRPEAKVSLCSDDGRAQCPSCGEALSEVEEIDDDIEATGYVQVVDSLRGLVHVGKVETSVNDDVTDRFHVDENDCPTFLLFHRGKMYRYKESAKDVRSLTNFAMYKFKEQRGMRSVSICYPCPSLVYMENG